MSAVFLWLGACIPSIVLAQNAAREAYAELPGARIFYIDTGGSGVPVVFLHAATGSSRVWDYQIPAFTAASPLTGAVGAGPWLNLRVRSLQLPLTI
jgi:hypothetical protein